MKLASNEKIDLSKVRLERTGFFKTVDIKPARIPGSPDQVDLNVAVEEQHSGTSTLASIQVPVPWRWVSRKVAV